MIKLYAGALAALILAYLTAYARADDIPAHPTPYSVSNPRLRPDSVLTPGDPRPDITRANLCVQEHPGGPMVFVDPAAHGVPGTAQYRHVTEAAAVYHAYGMRGDHTGYCAVDGGCEIDHLVSIELGGSNDAKNLWPQPYGGTPWNAHVKDKLENKLHQMVCAGDIDLADAQREIATDWIAAYRRYIGPDPH